jgi:hypothetical protein
MLLGPDGASFLRGQGVAFLAIDTEGRTESHEIHPVTSALPDFALTP